MKRYFSGFFAAFVLALTATGLSAGPIATSSAADSPAVTASSLPDASAITPIGDIRRGSMVTVHGTVERILDTDEFRIADDSGDIRVYIGYRNFVPVAEGETVHVIGFVDRDILKEIYAREIIHADGRVTQLRQGYE